MLDVVSSVCTSEVISTNCGEVMSGHVSEKHTCDLILCSLDFLFFSIAFGLLLLYSSVKVPPPSFALFSVLSPMMWHSGDVMQVCSHECLSGNFTLYFSHVRSQSGARIGWPYSIKYECLSVCKGMIIACMHVVLSVPPIQERNVKRWGWFN